MSILDMNFWSLIGLKKKPKARWSKYYSKKEMNLDVPNISIYQFLKKSIFQKKYGETHKIRYAFFPFFLPRMLFCCSTDIWEFVILKMTEFFKKLRDKIVIHNI